PGSRDNSDLIVRKVRTPGTGGRARRCFLRARKPSRFVQETFGAGVPLPGDLAGPMVNLPKAKPRSIPRPVPLSGREISPFVSAWAAADLPAPAWTSAWAYDPNSSLILRAPENCPVPPMTSDLPNVIPPPLALILTFAVCPLSQVMVPSPF